MGTDFCPACFKSKNMFGLYGIVAGFIGLILVIAGIIIIPFPTLTINPVQMEAYSIGGLILTLSSVFSYLVYLLYLTVYDAFREHCDPNYTWDGSGINSKSFTFVSLMALGVCIIIVAIIGLVFLFNYGIAFYRCDFGLQYAPYLKNTEGFFVDPCIKKVL